jgi:3-deoxy-D-manno-octulosonate 8-phosphate phosphatase (KDO 8-P phosphatase)
MSAVALSGLIRHVVFDVDGIFTDGSFFYSEEGKCFKRFGAHDSDGIKLLTAAGYGCTTVTADHRGYSISRLRMAHMGLECHLVSESDRLSWIQDRYKPSELIFMADGHHDAPILRLAAFGITVPNAAPAAKDAACFITSSIGGQGAVLEAALEILKRFGPLT